ncbi:MAG: GTP cyclohydrolase II [Thermotogae bacterium]|nr:GTP cyclohydrolase II [Thermotogota bacterium]
MEFSREAKLPTEFGEFRIFVVREGDKEHVVLLREPLAEPTLLRIHSECFTGDVLGSLRCDCGQQLHFALERIAGEGGILIYLRQEGRGIGLFNKINAYALQDEGYDTVQANHQLGFEADMRRYEIAGEILKRLGIRRVRLMTNNPHKVWDLTRFGIEVVERIPIEVEPNIHNAHYLRTKKFKLGHILLKV